MFWALLAGIAACTNAAYYIANKRFLRTLDPNLLAASGFLFTSFFLFLITLTRGIPALGPQFLMATLATVFLNVIATTLTFRALASSDISLAIPMISFTPLFLLVTAALLLGEYPSVIGLLGILIIVAGSYVLNTAAEHERLTDPFRNMISHPGVLAMLVVAFLFAVAINFDKMVVQNSDPFFGSATVFLMLGLSFAIIALVARVRLAGSNRMSAASGGAGDGRQSGIPGPVLPLIGAGIIIGLLLMTESVMINIAYLTQIVPYIISIKRMSIILIVLYGTIVFKEKEIVRRLSGACLMVLGAILILAFP